VRTEVRSDAPLIDMRMMRIPAVWTTNLVSLLFGVGMYAGYAFLPQFLQTPERAGYGFGATVTLSGLLLLPQSLATFVAGLLSGRLAARYGSKHLLVVGAGLSGVSQLALALVHEELWQVLAATVLGGTAFGLAFAAMSNLVVEAVPRSQTGVASGMNANIRTVGGAIGGAVLGSVVTAGARADGLPVEAGYTSGFAVLAGCSAVAALVALLVPVARRPEPEVLVAEVRHPELAVVASGTLSSGTAR
jgi:MFS family permease